MRLRIYREEPFKTSLHNLEGQAFICLRKEKIKIDEGDNSINRQIKWMVTLGVAIVMVFSSYMTSFAATGWVEEGDKWYYYDRYGNAVTNKWQTKDGVSYYLGEEGFIADNTWVKGSNGGMYYTDDSGKKVRSEWRFIYGYSNDKGKRDYYFDETGKMSTTKKLIDGETYYFTEDGEMLRGWIVVDGSEARQLEDTTVGENVYYSDETGARVSGWRALYAPEDDDWSEGSFWYYFKTDGKMRWNEKVGIDGKVYIFGEDGKRLSGWVYADLTKGAELIEDLNEDSDVSSAPLNNVANYYYAGGKDDGSIKQNVWINAVPAGEDDEDSDIDKEWYYTAKDGRLYYAGGVTGTGSGNIIEVVIADKAKAEEIGTTRMFTDKTNMSIGLKNVGTKTYAFDEEGIRVHGLIELTTGSYNFNSGVYYFGKPNDGVIKTGTVTLIDGDGVSHAYAFSPDTKNGMSKGQGVTGVASGKLYDNGLVVKAQEGNKYGVATITEFLYTGGVVTIQDAYFIVNESGKITTGIKTVVTADNGIKYRNAAKASVGTWNSIPPIVAVPGATGYIVQKHSGFGSVMDDSLWTIVTESESLDR